MTHSPATSGLIATPVATQARAAKAAAPATAVPWLWPLGLYLALSVLTFGIPVIAHPASHIIAVDDHDPSELMWLMAWWPHALLHGLNPLATNAIFYPDGYNLAWATSMPLPSVVLAPLTLAFGPAVSWNVLQLLAPALSAWTAFLLCRHIVRRTVPALIGGYVFGFSCYMLAHLQTSPNLALVALLPLFVLLVIRLLDGSMSTRRFVIAMTAALTAQFLISVEVLATAALFGGFAMLAAAALLPDLRLRLLRAAGWTAVALAATAVLVSPYLYYFFFKQQYPPGATNFPADLTSFVVPPASVLLRVYWHPPFAGSNLEEYLGVPLVLLIGIFAWQNRHRRAALLPVVCLLIAAVASLGRSGLDVRGHVIGGWMPWRLLSGLPVLRYAIPARFAVFVSLPAAVIVALWLRDSGVPALRGGDRRGLARWGLALVAVVVILPQFGSRVWNTAISEPPFFKNRTYRAYLTSRDHVLTIPAWGPSQRWIADAGFPFPMSAGSGGQGLPSSYTRYPIWNGIVQFPYALPPDYGAQLKRFLAAKDVTAVVVQQGFPGPWSKLFSTLQIKPVATGGVLLYRIKAPAGGAPPASATARP